jgi:WD40 repeat protein
MKGEEPFVEDQLTGTEINVDVRDAGWSVLDMQFDPTSSMLAVVTPAGVELRDVAGGEKVEVLLPGTPGDFVDIAVSDGARVVSTVGERGVALWNRDIRVPYISWIKPSNTRAASDLPSVIRSSSSAAFSNDGQLLAWTVHDGKDMLIVVWDLLNNREIARFPGQRVLRFNSDDQDLISSAFDDRVGPVQSTNLETRATTVIARELADVPESVGAEDGYSWDLDNGHGLGASIPGNGVVELWDVGRNQSIAAIEVSAWPDAASMAFDPRGTRLAIAQAGGEMSVIDTDPKSWWTLACSMAARPLSGEERENLIGETVLPMTCP